MIRIGRKIDIEKFVGASRGVAIAPRTGKKIDRPHHSTDGRSHQQPQQLL